MSELDLERLARAVKALIREFNWESENVRLVVGPIPYGPGPWTIGGNPDGNIACAIAAEYDEPGSLSQPEELPEYADDEYNGRIPGR